MKYCHSSALGCQCSSRIPPGCTVTIAAAIVRGRFKLAGIHDAHFAALGALRDRHVHRAKCEIARRASAPGGGLLIASAAARERSAGKMKSSSARHFWKAAAGTPKVLGEDFARRVRHPVREKHCRIFRKVSVVEDQQEFGAIRIQSLDRMRNSGRKIPEIAFLHVGHEAAAVGINRGDPRVSVEHDGPLAGCVPVQFADAACGEPHIHACDGCRDREFADGYLARPAAGVQPFVRDGERVLECLHAASVSAGRTNRVRILGVERPIDGAGFAGLSIIGGLGVILALRDGIGRREHSCCADCRSANPEETSPRKSGLPVVPAHVFRPEIKFVMVCACTNAGSIRPKAPIGQNDRSTWRCAGRDDLHPQGLGLNSVPELK